MQTIDTSHTAESPLPSQPVETTADLKVRLRSAEIESARTRAKQLMSEGKFSDARKALEEADSLAAEPKVSTADASKARLHRFVTGVESRFRKNAEESKAAAAATEAAQEKDANASALAAVSVERALKIVGRYSKIACGVGLLPTFVLNFAGVLAVQITMVWKIAKAFNRTDGKNHIRGSILSLIGSVLPGSVGHGIGLAVAAIPAVLTGTILSFVLAPAIAYAMTKAVGNVFIMHFESGGTLLTFDPTEFREHFVKEFKEAGGMSPSDSTSEFKEAGGMSHSASTIAGRL